jgi:hypothetical protein
MTNWARALDALRDYLAQGMSFSQIAKASCENVAYSAMRPSGPGD